MPWIGRIIGQCQSFSSFNFSIDPTTGYPKTEDCLKVSFDRFSRSPDVTSAWQHFYDDDAVQAAFEAYWGQVATESGDVPYQHVLCRTEMLLPLPSEDQAVIDAGGEPEEQVFLARIEFNFNGWSQQPDDVIVRIQPPAQ